MTKPLGEKSEGLRVSPVRAACILLHGQGMSASTPDLTTSMTLASAQSDRLGSVLLARFVLFALAQLLIASALALFGGEQAWWASSAWWPVSATIANVVTIALLRSLMAGEGRRFRDLFPFDRSRIGRDVALLAGVLVLSAPIAMVPNIVAGNVLFGDVKLAGELMFRPIPAWAALVSLIAFPVTVALSELPAYYGYAMPRLQQRTGRRWLAIALPVLMHAAQHCTLPLIFDVRFLAWRFVMFLPFAALLGVVLDRRPSLLPYLMVVHGLLDVTAVLGTAGLSLR